MKKRVVVLDVPVDAVGMDETVDIIEKFIKEKRSHIIVTANAEMVIQAEYDAQLQHILHHADLVLADGIGVVWAARRTGYPLPERVAGADLVINLLAIAALKGYKVFFLGAAPGIAELAAHQVINAYPGINISGVLDGYFTKNTETTVIATIKAANPDILLVGLGVPKQEKWIWQYKDELEIPVCIGVGGVIDILAGVVHRAPVWMQKAGLEWFYRLIKQPWRFLRMMALPKFVLLVLIRQIGKK